MKNPLTKIIIAVFVLANFLPTLPAEASQSGSLVVKLKEDVSIHELDYINSDAEYLFDQTYRLKTSDLGQALDYLNVNEAVEYAHPDYLLDSQVNTSDPLFVLDREELSKQWYLPKISVHEAWKKTTGSADVVVAIVDTGIDAKHQDLNDGRVISGYASYCQVRSISSSDSCLIRVSGVLNANINSDDNGHGTIVAGLIGAIPNNKGITGVNWNVSLMPIKALDSDGSGFASDVSAGIRWATDNGADIINLSIGGSGFAGVDILEEAIAYAYNNDVLVVAAGGNDAAVTGGDLDENVVYPVCADNGENMVVGVAAVDYKDVKAGFSNFGSSCIDISAPGTGTFTNRTVKQGIVSTYYDPSRPGEQDLYVYALGTSLAAPLVSGVAALMIDVFPELDVRAVRDRLLDSVDDISSVNTTGCNGASCVGEIGTGRINAEKAVQGSVAFSSGALVKDFSGNTYLIERGIKRPISSFVLAQRFSNSIFTQSDQQELSEFPTGLPVPPIDGTLVKDPNNSTVYVVEGGERRGLSYLAFLSRNFTFADISVLDPAEIAGYPLGTDAEVLDGLLMKLPEHPAVFVISEGKRQLLSYFVFSTRFAGKQIAEVNQSILSSYPLDPELFPPADGTLVKGDSSATVYMTENGMLRPLTYTAFQTRGLSFEKVSMISQAELSGYEIGEPIIN